MKQKNFKCDYVVLRPTCFYGNEVQEQASGKVSEIQTPEFLSFFSFYWRPTNWQKNQQKNQPNKTPQILY